MTQRALVLAVVAFACQAHGQWVRTAGPEGGFASAILNTGQSILLAAGSLYRSTEEGGTWTASDAGLGPETGGITALALKGSTVFVGTGMNGIYRSTDDGITWQRSSLGIHNLTDISDLSLNDSLIFAASESRGVYRSTDNGTTWVQVNTGITDTTVVDVLLHGTEVYAGTWATGVFESSNNGESWSPMNAGLTGDALRLQSLAGTPASVLAGTRDGVYRSTDNGASWVKAASGLTTGQVSVLLPRASDIVAGTLGNGVYRSTNDGVDWSPVNTGLGNTNIRGIAASGNALFVGTYGGRTVYRSTDNGSLWTAAGKGIVSSGNYAITVVGGRVIAASYEGIRATTDGGDTWSRSDSGARSVIAYALYSRGPEVYMGSTGSGVYRSADSGISWTPASGGLITSTARSVWSLADDGTALYAGTIGGVYRSTNSGGAWLPASPLPTDSLVVALLAKPGLLFAGTRQGVFRSTDQGTNWTASPASLPSYYVYALTNTGPTVVAAMASGIYRSTDDGDTWISPGGIPPEAGQVRAFTASGGNLFAGTGLSHAYVSTDDGQNWTDISAGLLKPAVGLQGLITGTGYLWGATSSSGVWKRKLSEVISSANERGEPLSPFGFALLQNYPNPLNPSTTIQYTLPHRSRVVLSVFNALGQKVVDLVNGDIDAGYHEVQFNGSQLASGVYFYRLQAGAFVQTKSLALVR